MDPRHPEIEAVDLSLAVEVRSLPQLERALPVNVRETALLNKAPWVRSLGKLALEVTTQGWRFPAPGEFLAETGRPATDAPPDKARRARKKAEAGTRLQPPGDMVIFKDRLLYLLQPPLEDLFAGKQVRLPFPPYPYQIKGIAFL